MCCDVSREWMVLVADLQEGVTDSGLSALAAAGCGAQLTSLTLHCE